ncbi:uncharacterized protein LOC131649493 [Vicia villosa]|uniref:uncharacterized protein LOC131649493 n=1 Tax=Vicia villosa TaxID=3911 RepID=UPI00273B0A49|nr:uncharacterized protein LOC131649493 [Vicia villosa]
MATENNLTTLIKRIMANNSLNTGLRRPNYTSPVADYILQTELPRGTKVPKFTKFSRDTSESTVEHIARYLTEADTWAHLERMFHELFYMGQTKISLKELASINRKFIEPIDDYLNRFRLLKSRCFTVVPEHELVEMAAGAEKAGENKNYKKERVAYVEAEDVEVETFDDSYGFDEVEIDLDELKEEPPYSCKLLTPSNGKNLVETDRNDKFPKKTYTFDVTKCDEIFDLLVKDDQMIDGRLKFADKGKNNMKVDADPLNVADTNYAEPVDINMVDVSKVDITEWEMVSAGSIESLNDNMILNTEIEGSFKSRTTEDLRLKLQNIRIPEVPPAGVNMVNIGQPLSEIEEPEKCLVKEKEKGNYGNPRTNESLKEYLWRCHEKNVGRMLMCPRCSIMLS